MPTYTSNFNFGKPIPFSSIDENLWGYILNTTLDSVDSQLATRTALYDFADFQLRRAEIRDYCETETVVTYGATPTFDMSLGNHFFMTLTGNVTSYTISNPPPTGKRAIFRLTLRQDDTGGRTFAVAAAAKPVGSVTLDTTSNTESVLLFDSNNAFSTYKYTLTATGIAGL